MESFRTCLLNPGPVTLSKRVREALLRDDLCHRDPEFSELQRDVRAKLASVYAESQRDYSSVLLTGSGTAAVEAMVGSLVPHSGKALVVINGVYGERIAAMLKIQEKTFDIVATDVLEPIDITEVDRRLQSDASITHVIAVHHETTTGRLNDIAALGAVCKQRRVHLLLDAVSSFGGEAIEFEAWNLQACAATANKCLHGVPGVSFVLARRDTLEVPASNAKSLYLDLFRNFREQETGYPMFTPAVQATYALREALCELDEQGGWQKRHSHYQHLSGIVRDGMRHHSHQLLIGSEHEHSSVLTSFLLPARVSFDKLFLGLKRRGFVIYAGQQGLNGKIFRVAVMGDLCDEDMLRFIDCFNEVVDESREHSTEAITVV